MVGLGGQLRRSCRQLAEARIAHAVIDTVPLAWFRWPAEQEHDANPDQASYAEFVDLLTSADAAQLEAARLALHRSGIPFSAKVSMGSGGAYVVEGRRAR